MKARRIALLAQADNWHTLRWARWLADEGNTVAVFSDTSPREGMNYEKITIVGPQWNLFSKVYAFKIRGGTYANNWHKWRAYAHQVMDFKPAIAHAMEARAYGPILPHLPHVPRVLTPWGTDMRCLDEKDLAPQRPEESALVRESVDAADIIATNAPGKELLWQRISGLPADRFELFPWGFDEAIFRYDANDNGTRGRKLLGVDTSAKILLSPRLAQNNYHIQEIIQAWVDLREVRSDLILVILRAGADADTWAALNSRKDELRASGIHFVNNYFTQEDMASIYRASSGFVMFPDDDLLAQSLLEGTACGAIPVVRRQDCYDTLISDWDAPNSNKPRAFISHRSGDLPADIRRTIARWLKSSERELQPVRASNSEYVSREYQWKECARRMLDVYTHAEENFARRTNSK
ncbi:MAG: glycosyltransferase [Candidatus Sumerlaeota bacterium]